MAERKEIRKYTFTVEGETEKWYLKWLEAQINSMPESRYQVSIDPKVMTNPLKFAKSVNPIAVPTAIHLCDYESNDDEHVKNFHSVLDSLKESNKLIGRSFRYTLGYSNFSFELWIVLHKMNCHGILTDRSQYLNYINRAFSTNFSSLRQYKEEANFSSCLRKLSLDDVKQAIRRAKQIMSAKSGSGVTPREYKGFTYYHENPALSVWESIEKILKESSLM